MKKRHLLILGILFLILASLLALTLYGFARDIVAVEVLRVVWILRIIAANMPQLPVWVVFLLTAVVIALGALLKGERATWRPIEPERPREQHVRTLAGWIERAQERPYSRWRLAQMLGDLTQETLAYTRQTDPADIRRRFQTGTLDIPKDVQSYVRAGFGPMLWQQDGFLSKILPRKRPSLLGAALHLDPERVIQFLEEQLEM
ncbi:MAG: hypothetical protein JXD18_06830 [Anaerolineae bacterium]|nr:hypothetical protein [Anaerolineae bacterium]